MELEHLNGIWALQTKDIVSLKFMMTYLVLLCPAEFCNQAGSCQQLLECEVEEKEILNELLFQLKAFFIERNLEGKSLFKVLIRKADPRSSIQQQNTTQYMDEILWKVYELIFAVAFFIKGQDQSCIFTKALANLSSNAAA